MDYAQIGLDLVLYEYDIRLNRHICFGLLGRHSKAQDEMVLAKKCYPGSIRLYSTKIKDLKKVYNPPKSTPSSRKGSVATLCSTNSTISDPESPKRVEFVYQGTSKVMEVPSHVNYDQLLRQLSKKCGQDIEVFGMTDNDFLQIADDRDLQAMFQRSYIVLYCQ